MLCCAVRCCSELNSNAKECDDGLAAIEDTVLFGGHGRVYLDYKDGTTSMDTSSALPNRLLVTGFYTGKATAARADLPLTRWVTSAC